MMSDKTSSLPRTRATALTTRWPQGATAGLLIVGAACLGVSLTLYHVAGPRDVFAGELASRP